MLKRLLAGVLAATTGLGAFAEPFASGEACFVRAEPRPAGRAANVVPAASESRLGIRRKTGQLFDVEMSVVGADGALCSISGVARLRAGDVLVLPVRPDGGRAAKPPATPCLVSLRNLGAAIEISTTEAPCQAQSLCAGQVQLQGQRFDVGDRLPGGGRSACFASTPP